MPKRIRSRGVKEQYSLIAMYPNETGWILFNLYNHKKGLIHPDHPWLNPTADRKNIRVNPRGKGTPRKNKKYHNKDVQSGFDILVNGKHARGNLPAYLTEYQNQGAIDLSEKTVPDAAPKNEAESFPVVPIPVTFKCGHSDVINFEIRTKVTLKEVQAHHRENVLCENCYEDNMKARNRANTLDFDAYHNQD